MWVLSRRVRTWLAALVAVIGISLSRGAQAQDKVAAEALFDQAKKALTEGRLDEACKKFKQSQELDPAVGTLLYLGECYEKMGKTASAWATFREAASSAMQSGQGQRADIGNARAAKLEPGLSKLTIEVSPQNDVEGFQLMRGGQAVPRGVWGVPVPVDPGDTVIAAKAPGYQDWQQTVNVGGNGATLSLTVPPLPKAPEPPPGAKPAPPTPVAPADRPAEPQKDQGQGQRSLGITLGGLGLVGVGIGGFFGLKAISKANDANDICPDAECSSARAVDLADQANDAAVVANIGVGVGAALAVGGLVVYLTAPSAPESALRLTPRVSSDQARLDLAGAF